MEEVIASLRPMFHNVTARAQEHHEELIHPRRSLFLASNVNEVAFVLQGCEDEQGYLLHPIVHLFSFEVTAHR
jgi:hypothetical protein